MVTVKCPKCGSLDVDSYSRITGFLSNINGWNRGKVAELKDRYKYRDYFKQSI